MCVIIPPATAAEWSEVARAVIFPPLKKGVVACDCYFAAAARPFRALVASLEGAALDGVHRRELRHTEEAMLLLMRRAGIAPLYACSLAQLRGDGVLLHHRKYVAGCCTGGCNPTPALPFGEWEARHAGDVGEGLAVEEEAQLCLLEYRTHVA